MITTPKYIEFDVDYNASLDNLVRGITAITAAQVVITLRGPAGGNTNLRIFTSEESEREELRQLIGT